MIESGYGLETVFGFAFVGVAVCISYLLCDYLSNRTALASTVVTASVEITRCDLHGLWHFGGLLYGGYLNYHRYTNG